MSSRNIRSPLLFEVGWEVANKVGGIYTVLRTKAPVTSQEFNDRFYMLGPLFHAKAHLEVEQLEPQSEPLKRTLNALNQRGIRFLHGRWLIEGAPMVILFDLGSIGHELNRLKGELWDQTKIPSPPHDSEMDQSILLGYMVAWFLQEYLEQDREHGVIAHFHEWQVGVGLVLARKWQLDLATVFTTHATLLGRYLCAGDTDFYNNLNSFDVDQEAGKRGIYHRYCLERASAHCADVFTTVSHITAYEAESLLKRKPDGVLPNGLNVVKFQAVHEFQNLHAKNKEKIHEFIRGHFYGHYDFDLDNTLYFFTAGRYEFRNKGADMFLESLARLNWKLNEAKSNVTVVAFIIMPTPTQSFTVETLKGHAVVKQLQDTVDHIKQNIGRRIFEAALQGEELDYSKLISEDEKLMLKRRKYALKRDGLPPIVTHNVVNDSIDPVLCAIRRLQLFNNRHDRVKVVFHPEFLNASNPVLGLDYDDFVRGCHLGVFPSYYEPWGYTPAECTVMGLPSITTNLSGFGCYMEDNIEHPEDYGIYIVDRRLKSADESVQQLADHMYSFASKSRRQRINQRNRTERLSDLLDWKRMGLEYVRARHLALRRAYPSQFEHADGEQDEDDFLHRLMKVPRPLSVPPSPRVRSFSFSNAALTYSTDDPFSYQMSQLQLEEDGRFSYIGLKQGGVLEPRHDDQEEN